MAAYTQDKRLTAVTTPLGKDVFLLTAFAGQEDMSRLFFYQLDFLSEKDNLAAKDIVGKEVGWVVNRADKEPRYFHGVVSRFATGGLLTRGLRQYRAVVVPWLWFLTRTTDCRIFQEKTAPDIIQQIFKDLGFSAFELKLTASYVKRQYCVQYRETDFNFVSRLMEQEGIFYFFRHEKAKHTLVLADQKTAYKDCPEKEVVYSVGSTLPSHLTRWEHGYEFRSGKYAQKDYNFETPSTDLMTKSTTVVPLPDNKKFEIYDYPGDYRQKAEGGELTKIHMEEEEVAYDVVEGESTCSTFTPGGKFVLKKYDFAAEEGKGYVITSVRHSARNTSYTAGGPEGEDYRNSFTCIPDSVTFRPARSTPRPVVQGPQTAVVVGPANEEIYTDKYGRVKVQFHWDREGKKDDKSSCWIRVAENWAGKNWGIVFNPRIGQEVIVDFLEGDPDRPIITGRVYNAEQMPPYELPANQTQSGIKTRSSKEGTTANFNEIRFEDKKDKEEFVIHAERNLSETVEVNESVSIGNDQTIHVFHNRSVTVGGGKNNKDTKKDGTFTETIEGDVKIAVQKGDYYLDVQKGKMDVHVKGPVTQTFEDKLTVTAKNAISVASTDATVLITAKTDIKLEVGGSSLLLKQDGTIELKGKTVTIEGSQSVTVKPAAITLDGTQVKITGAVIDILSKGPATMKGTPVKLNC
jgi:type VI secretion system secreted protein VgrG